MKHLKRETALYTRFYRLKGFVYWFAETYQPICCFCSKVIKAQDFESYRDSLTIHHLNENRKDNGILNLAICHRGCHIKYHKKKRIQASLTQSLERLATQLGGR